MDRVGLLSALKPFKLDPLSGSICKQHFFKMNFCESSRNRLSVSRQGDILQASILEISLCGRQFPCIVPGKLWAKQAVLVAELPLE